MRRNLSHRAVRRKNHVLAPPAIPATPMRAVTRVQIMFPTDPSRRSPTPSGVRTNIKGTIKAGIVYFHAIIIVLKGLPPVRAAAAKGESAVGGETSESTA